MDFQALMDTETPENPSAAPTPEDASEHVPDTGAVATADGSGQVKAARELVGGLMRSLKTLRLYAPGNPVYQKAQKDVGDRLQAFVSEHGPLALGVARDHLHVDGESVHEDEDPREGLAFRLYADGVRAIHFGDGLTPDDAKQAMTLIAQGTALATADDDLVTLFWNAQIVTVELSVVDESYTDQPLTSTQHLPKPSLEEVSGRIKQAPPSPQRVSFGPDVMGVFRLTEEDSAYLERLIRREEVIDPVADLMSILVDVLAIEKDADEFIDVLGDFRGLVTGFLERGRLDVSVQAMRGLVQLHENPGDDQTPEMTGAIEVLMADLGRGPMLDALVQGVSSNFSAVEESDVSRMPEARRKDLADLTAYLGRIDADPVELLKVAGGFALKPLRECFIDHVAKRFEEEHSGVAELLLDDDTRLVSCALMVLARVGDEADLPHMKSLAGHADVYVRRSALDAVTRITGGGHTQILSYLGDPDARIRRRALATVQSAEFADALPALQDLIKQPFFTTWELNDRRQVFAAIGGLAGEDAIPFFGEHLIVKKRLFFRPRRDDDAALCAVAGLRRVGTFAASGLLKKGLKHPNPRVRGACEAALMELKDAE